MNQPLKNILVVGYPKSGNTWLNYLISFSLNLPYQDFDAPNNIPRQEWVKKAVSGKHDWDSVKKYSAVLKTHKLSSKIPKKDGVIFYISRDPRDVFVSYMHFMKLGSTGKLGMIRFYLLGLFGRKFQIRWFTKNWNNHLSSWKNLKPVNIQYEKLLSQGSKYFNNKLIEAGFDVSSEITDLAFKTFSFEKMTGGRKRGNEDKKSFFRRGIAGDWKNYFNRSELEYFNRNLPAEYLISEL